MNVLFLKNITPSAAYEFAKAYSAIDHTCHNIYVVYEDDYGIFQHNHKLSLKFYSANDSNLSHIWNSKHYTLDIIDFYLVGTNQSISKFLADKLQHFYYKDSLFSPQIFPKNEDYFFSKIVVFSENTDYHNFGSLQVYHKEILNSLANVCTIEIYQKDFNFEEVFAVTNSANLVISHNDIVARLCTDYNIPNLVVYTKDRCIESNDNQVIFDPYKNIKLEYPPNCFVRDWQRIDKLNDKIVDLNSYKNLFINEVWDTINKFKIPYKTDSSNDYRNTIS